MRSDVTMGGVLRRRRQPEVPTPDLLTDIQALCDRLGVPVVPTPPDAIVGVADDVGPGAWPVHGLRHTPGTTSGWFVWSGGDPGPEDDFFKPTHASHLVERCPEVMRYLGLPPGHRILIAPGHEDIWFDPDVAGDVV